MDAESQPFDTGCNEYACSSEMVLEYQVTEMRMTDKTKKRIRAPPTGTRDFQCDLCDKAYATKWGLTKHEANHTGAHKFSCQLCQKGFMEIRDLNKHIQTHKRQLIKSNLS